MKLAVGFITYNQASAAYLESFLPSLKLANEFLPSTDYRLMAFDNSDPDNNINRLTLEFFSHRSGLMIDYLTEGKNIGFGSAYNRLLNKADKLGAKYFLVINPDTILSKDAIKLMLAALEADKELAAVSPKILRWNFKNNLKTKQIDSCGLILRSGLRFADLGQGETDEGQHDGAKIIGPSGAAGMYRLSALKKIKQGNDYFDPKFFMYKEDCDLAYRLQAANLKSSLVPAAIIYHDRTVAAYDRGIVAVLRNRRRLSRQVRAWSFRNQHLLFVKHFKNENFVSQTVIFIRVILLLFFSLILEQFNLKQYPQILKALKS